MKGFDSAVDQDFEDELRAMLHRRAADVRPNPPDWEDLLRRSGAVVVSLHTGRPVNGAAHRTDRRRSWSWVRPALAAAACLAVVMAAGIAIGRSSGSGTDERDESDGGPVAASEEDAGGDILPAAGNPDFQPASATAVFPALSEAELRTQIEQENGVLPVDRAWMADPQSATEEYLTQVGIDSDASPYELWVDPPVPSQGIDAEGNPVETATVWWSLRDTEGAQRPSDPPIVTIGYVFLRNLAGPGSGDTEAWAVVGTATQGLTLSQVRRDGDRLQFAVALYQGTDADVDATGDPVRITVNDTVVAEEPLSAQRTEFTHTLPAEQAAAIRLQQIGGLHPISVTETLFPTEVDRTPNGDRTTPTVDSSAQESTMVATFDRDCAASAEVSVRLELSPGFRTDRTSGAPETTETAGAEDALCVVDFAHTENPDARVTVGWGTPTFPVPDDLQGPVCFRWASLDDGGFVAVRTDPSPIYVIGEGMTSDEFERAVVGSSIVSGADTWAADEGC